MSVQPKISTSAEFYEFVQRHENRDRRFERVRREIVEVSPSGALSSFDASLIGHFFWTHLLEQGNGFVLTADAGINFPDDTTYSPDVSVYTTGKRADLPIAGFYDRIPDLAVEVVLPGNSAAEIHAKVTDYLNAGVGMVWVVYPVQQHIVVHTAEGAKTYGVDATIDVGAALPGFTLAVRRAFP